MTNLHGGGVGRRHWLTGTAGVGGFAIEPELGLGVSAREHTMGRVEYKLERVAWIDEHEARLDQLMEHINEWAKDGWWVPSVDLTLLGSFGLKKLPVLLEREVP
jgi:hypothetical protein